MHQLRRHLLLTLPVLPALLAAALSASTWTMVAVLAVGLATLVLSLATRLHQASLLLGRSVLQMRVVATQLLPAHQEPTARAKISVPLAAISHGLGRLLCSLPPTVHLELCLTGLWIEYLRGEGWHQMLLALERDLEDHFDEVTLTATQWQSPFILLETGQDHVGVLLFLEKTGQFGLYLDTTTSNLFGSANRRMNQAIFKAAIPLAIKDLEPPSDEGGDDDPV